MEGLLTTDDANIRKQATPLNLKRMRRRLQLRFWRRTAGCSRQEARSLMPAQRSSWRQSASRACGSASTLRCCSGAEYCLALNWAGWAFSVPAATLERCCGCQSTTREVMAGELSSGVASTSVPFLTDYMTCRWVSSAW